uniref:Transposase n=1 Tax=Romanomermis culicivorax TaxID=13658 RepID=A0A915KNL8_ROMCU
MKMNLPFLSYPKIVELQTMNGVYMGYHHYDRISASHMALVISEEMYKMLIQLLTSKQYPLSIIIDSSTDASQNHYLIAYFQALENGTPVVYFYKLVQLDVDEIAAALLNKLVETWNKEPHRFTQHLKKNLRGYASDGAAVMTGKKGGL